MIFYEMISFLFKTVMNEQVNINPKTSPYSISSVMIIVI